MIGINKFEYLIQVFQHACFKKISYFKMEKAFSFQQKGRIFADIPSVNIQIQKSFWENQEMLIENKFEASTERENLLLEKVYFGKKTGCNIDFALLLENRFAAKLYSTRDAYFSAAQSRQVMKPSNLFDKYSRKF